MLKLDPKVKRLIIFLSYNGSIVVSIILGLYYLIPDRDILKLIGALSVIIIVYRVGLSIYRKLILPPKDIKSYGSWSIVTGSTSGIGKEYAEYLAKYGQNIIIISRDEKKLISQAEELKEMGKQNGFNIEIKYIAHDFTKYDLEIRNLFYNKIDQLCKEYEIGLLINNVGIANEYPKYVHEFTDEEADNLIICNIHSVVTMTRKVYPHMLARNKGAIVNVSSGSGNHPGPLLAIYSATKAFITQFSRSLHVECFDTGVDILVVTPFYVVSNLYKRKYGTLIAPLPIELVKGTFKHLGKPYVWQTHGYWFHGILGNIGMIYPGSVSRYRRMMLDNRKRHDEKINSTKNKKVD